MYSLSKINIVLVLFVIFAAMESVYTQECGKRCGCRLSTRLPVVELLNPLLEPVCDLVGCLVNFYCARDCSSKLVTALDRLLQGVFMSLTCDHGLVCCPDPDILRVEDCLANPFVTGGSVKPLIPASPRVLDIFKN